MGFYRQEDCNGLPSFFLPRALPDPGIELGSHALQADSLLTELPGKPNNSSNKVQKTVVLACPGREVHQG